ncbi:NAD-dependent epimerase/dehydratase family protein [Donghicola sp. XS_ASV15]|uniref:NAD-dependent epimerase/dehydratase family protein n=1 Tax=Donghicola sp. XS_ASV15 TaxID=3241295 RepID=UPI003517CA21
MTGTVLILGASGKIGRHAHKAFNAAGWTVRLYDRKARDMTAQAKSADVIVNGLNPPNYHNWAELIPEITADVIAAARANEATVIIPGNLYVFGDRPGLWDEATPHRPVSRKGHIREEMERAYESAGIQTIILRAGDFISATAGDDDLMGIVHLRAIRKGVVTALGAPDVMHAYTYLPDWANCAVRLAEMRAQLPAWTDLCCGGMNFTISDLARALETATGRNLSVKEFAWWQMRLAAPVWELARELLEMRYLWQTPHRLGSERLAKQLPDFHCTDIQKVMTAGLPADMHRPDYPQNAAVTL